MNRHHHTGHSCTGSPIDLSPCALTRRLVRRYGTATASKMMHPAWQRRIAAVGGNLDLLAEQIAVEKE